MTYYNTTHEQSKPLEVSWAKAAKQDVLILLVFARNKKSIFTPFEIQNILRDDYEKPYPITSVRRSISNLTEREALEKTSIRRQGPFGATNYCWKYAI